MKLTFLSFLATAVMTASTAYAGPCVLIETDHGNIKIDLNEEKAPKTVANFLRYVEEGFYDNTVFHRIIEDFMIQGGGFEVTPSGDISKKTTKAPVENEAKNGLKNTRGSIAMARTSDPHSATAQFFINHKDNTNLDYPSFDNWGYAVFGNVTEGLDVVDKIAAVETGAQDRPTTNVVIKSIKVVE